MDDGWIKLYYRFKEWEWSNDPNMVALFVHLLLSANYKAVRWRGRMLKPGTVVTSRRELSSRTGIPERTVRTCLERLEATKEIILRVSQRGTLITICNYERYQSVQRESDPLPTHYRPTTDPLPTHIIESKNNILYSEREITREEFLDFFFSEERRGFNEVLCISREFKSLENFRALAEECVAEWFDWPPADLKDAMNHLLNHCSRKQDAKRLRQQYSPPKGRNYGTTPTFERPADGPDERRQQFAERVAVKVSTPDPGEPDVDQLY